jgi:hypothetical protein
MTNFLDSMRKFGVNIHTKLIEIINEKLSLNASTHPTTI